MRTKWVIILEDNRFEATLDVVECVVACIKNFAIFQFQKQFFKSEKPTRIIYFLDGGRANLRP